MQISLRCSWDMGVAEWKGSRGKRSFTSWVFISGWRDHQADMKAHCQEVSWLHSYTKAFLSHLTTVPALQTLPLSTAPWVTVSYCSLFEKDPVGDNERSDIRTQTLMSGIIYCYINMCS